MDAALSPSSCLMTMNAWFQKRLHVRCDFRPPQLFDWCISCGVSPVWLLEPGFSITWIWNWKSVEGSEIKMALVLIWYKSSFARATLTGRFKTHRSWRLESSSRVGPQKSFENVIGITGIITRRRTRLGAFHRLIMSAQGFSILGVCTQVYFHAMSHTAQVSTLQKVVWELSVTMTHGSERKTELLRSVHRSNPWPIAGNQCTRSMAAIIANAAFSRGDQRSPESVKWPER